MSDNFIIDTVVNVTKMVLNNLTLNLYYDSYHILVLYSFIS